MSVSRYTSEIAARVAIKLATTQVVAAAVLLYGGVLVWHGALARGTLVAFLLYQQQLAATLDMLGSVFSSAMAGIGAADAVVRLLRRPSRDPLAGAVTAPAMAGHVELRAVRFAYPSRPEARLTPRCLHANRAQYPYCVGKMRVIVKMATN